jgi:hypothetical protein
VLNSIREARRLFEIPGDDAPVTLSDDSLR